MKIYKSKFGWSTTAHSKTMEGEKIECYLDTQFQKGYEPMGEDIEGKLIFRDNNGVERDCFFTSYRKKDGTVHPKLFVMGTKLKDQQMPLGGGDRDLTGHFDNNVTINTDDLPFY